MNGRRLVGVSAGIALLVASSTACGEVGSDLTLVSSNDMVVPVDKPARGYDQFLADSIISIEAFWAEQYPEHYKSDYPRLAGGVHAHFPQREAPLPDGCDFSGDYADVEDNAFYCDEGDFIVYDDELLLPSFVDEFGIAVAGVIMAHEWGTRFKDRRATTSSIYCRPRHSNFRPTASPEPGSPTPKPPASGTTTCRTRTSPEPCSA